jgi:hypothetical protein
LKKSKSPPGRAELFGRVDVPEYAGCFSAEHVIASWLPFSPSRGGLLVAGMDVGYTQPIRRVYELGPAANPGANYYIAGRAKGDWQAAQILGPSPLQLEFFRTFTPPCPQAPALTCEDHGERISEKCSAPPAWALSQVEVSGLLLNTAAGGFALQEQVQGRFDGLKVIEPR